MKFLGKILNWSNPTVIYTCNRWVNIEPPNAFDRLIHSIKSKKIIVLVAIWWTIEPGAGSSRKLIEWVKKIEAENINVTIILCANTLKEYQHLNTLEVRCIFCNQNIFKDYTIFRPLNLSKQYDAIYNAQFLKFKRHHLAQKINNLALIGYNFNADPEYFNSIIKGMPQADILNYSDDGVYKFLSKEKCNTYINMSHVGLCLSEKEGAMYASMEYLLADLPVVSTKSYGGRDLFLDYSNSTIVDPDPVEVHKAVYSIIRNKPKPGKIRQKAILDIEKQRAEFINYIERMISQHGGNRINSFINDWKNLFIDQLLEEKSIDEIISTCNSYFI